MPNELGTKDVLEQVNTRLGNVEQDLRSFRAEVSDRFDSVNDRFDSVNDRFDSVNDRFDSVNDRFAETRSEFRGEIQELRREMNGRFSGIDQRFNWMYGLLVAILMAVAGLWIK